MSCSPSHTVSFIRFLLILPRGLTPSIQEYDQRNRNVTETIFRTGRKVPSQKRVVVTPRLIRSLPLRKRERSKSTSRGFRVFLRDTGRILVSDPGSNPYRRYKSVRTCLVYRT